MNIITALGNEEINLKLKKFLNLEIIGKDIQYQEAVIEVLEEKIVDLLILSSILPGELNIREFINIIKYKNPNVEIFIILEKENENLKEFFISKGINNIYYNNKITINEILEKINETKNKNIINKKINNLEKIILNNKNNNLLKIKNKIKYLRKILKNKNKKTNKKNNKKIITIIGAKKIGKTIFSLIFSLNIKNKKILIIDFNSEKNNMKIIIGKKVKNELISWKKNIDILFLKNHKDNEKTEKILSNYIEKYDYIIIDLDYDFEKGNIIKKADEIIILVEPNLLGLKETREILEVVVNKQKNHKDNIKVIFNKQCNTAINSIILKNIFSDFKIIGNIQYDKNYNIFINTNGKIITNKIQNDYLKIAKKII